MEHRIRDLQRAYDQDATRRGAEDPSGWRTEVVDDLAGRVRGAGSGRQVLDLGCGAGQNAARLAGHDLDVLGVDLSVAMAEATRERGVPAVVADHHRLPLASDSVHGVLAFNSFLHTPKDRLGDLFGEVHRVLVPGAPLTMVVWGGVSQEGPMDRDWLEPPRFFSLFDDEALERLETPGFLRQEVRFLHDQARHGLHPQVMLLTAEPPVRTDTPARVGGGL